MHATQVVMVAVFTHVCYSFLASQHECTARGAPGTRETTRTTYITDRKYFVSSASVTCMIPGD